MSAHRPIAAARRFQVLTAGLLWLAAPAIQAAPVEVDGVRVDEAVTLAGHTLTLNGAGWHKRGYLHAGVTALYTESPVHSLEALESAPGPKRVTLVATREVPGSLASRYFLNDFENCVRPDEFLHLIDEVSRIGALFSTVRVIHAGEAITIDVVPGKGVMASMAGVPLTPPGAATPWFANDLLGRVMLRMYVGGRVPAELAANLLGLSTSMRGDAATAGASPASAASARLAVPAAVPRRASGTP